MKRFLCMVLVCVLSLSLACSKENTEAPHENEPNSGETQMSEAVPGSLFSFATTLDAQYAKTSHAYQYLVGEDLVSLTIERDINKDPSFEDAEDVFSKDGYTIAYYIKESKSKDDTKESYSYGAYVTYVDRFSFTLSNPTYSLMVNELLSFEDALSLFSDPLSPPDGCKFLLEEWYLRLTFDRQVVSVLIYPNDGGAEARASSLTFTETTMEGYPCYLNAMEDTLAFTDGTHSILITEVLTEGTEYEYRTIAFAQSILEQL